MRQGRFSIGYKPWGRKRRRRIELSDRGIFEPVALEEDVVKEAIQRLWYAGIPAYRERERIPVTKCQACGAKVFVGAPSQAGNPDLHGYIPPRVLKGLSHPVAWYAEMKRPGGRRRVAQMATIDQMRRDGVPAFFADKWDDFRTNFAPLGLILPT